jgi:putative transposase
MLCSPEHPGKLDLPTLSRTKPTARDSPKNGESRLPKHPSCYNLFEPSPNFRESMAKLHRLRQTDRIFFVTATLIEGAPDYTADEFPILLDAFVESRMHLGFLICGYVLMPDHWHALLWPSSPLTISRVLKDIRTRCTKSLNQIRRTKGTTGQDQFWDRFVRNRKEYNDRMEYMHLNPVRAGLVERAEDWPWSSYNNFPLDESIVAACPIRIDYIHLSDEYRG